MRRMLSAGLLPAAAILTAACGGEGPAPASAAARPGVVVMTPAQVEAAGIATETTRLEQVRLPLRVAGTVVTPDPFTVHLGSIVEGRIERVDVLPGDRVPAGTSLIHIHSHEVATAQRDLAAAEAQERFAEAAYDRSSRLFAAEAVSREEVERREAQLEEARAELTRSREMIAHLSPSPAGHVVVRAPRAGTVFDVKVRPGEAVVVGAPLVDLGDASRLWVTGFIPENAAVGIAPGTPIMAGFDALPGADVSGKVVRLGGIVDSLRRAVEVRVSLDNVPAGVRPGMFASLLIPVADLADRVVLPPDAVQRSAAGDVVFIEDGPGAYHVRAVKSMALPDGRMAVEGLAGGIPVVVRGAYVLKSQLEAAPQSGE
jgi:cobalt-zinc-cadmium efflux system membrane fusion protein